MNDILLEHGIGSEVNPLKAFSNPTLRSGYMATNTTDGTSKLSINGSGWVVFIASNVEDGTENINLKIDGSYKIGTSTVSSVIGDNEIWYLMYRFETSFEYFDYIGGKTVVDYCLGDKFEEAEHHIFGGIDSSAQSLSLAIEGKGWIYGVTSASNCYTRLVVDGKDVITNKQTFSMPLMIPYKTGFEYYAGGNMSLTYTQE